uniref:F-box domain-containing protein n=1 Tax=Moniliophthora roreri TaxID=221103 RepID=A0A0W0FGW4_MONRR
MSPSSILDLPIELCLRVLEHLDGPSLARSRLTCKYIRSLVDDSSNLQHKIELSITQKEDGIYSPLTVAEKLRALRNHQRAWDRLEWKQDKCVPMAGGSLWELFGNVLAQQDDSGSILFRQLPSRYRGIEEKEWRIQPDIPRVRDFGMDPSQDLLVLIEAPRWWGNNADRCHRFYLRTMSKCTKHPLARDGFIVHKQMVPDRLSYSIQVSGDNVGVLFNSLESGENELVIWDWKTGFRKLYLTGDEMRSFCFLSERHVVLTIRALSSEEELVISLLVVDFESESSEQQAFDSPQRSFSLHLPNLGPTITPVYLNIKTDPTPMWTPNPELQVPFHNAHSNRLYVVSLAVQADEAVKFVVLFVPWTTIMSHMGVLGAKDENMLEWHTWGPKGKLIFKNSDVFETSMNRNLQELVSYLFIQSRLILLFGNATVTGRGKRSGSVDYSRPRLIRCRYVVQECSHRTNDAYTILLYDFNQRAVRRDTASHCCDDPSDLQWLPLDETLLVTKPSVTPGVFGIEVETCLPYRVRIASLSSTSNHCALMCSEDAVVVVDVSAPFAVQLLLFPMCFPAASST